MIAAIVLAAGKSERMGRSKMNLPWGETTVVGQVVKTLVQAGVDEIVVVTGGAKNEVESALNALPSDLPLRTVFNPHFDNGDMRLSFTTGLSLLDDRVEAALFTLGDQPQVEVEVIRSILTEFKTINAPLIVPSYKLHRGHPWLIARPLWSAVLNLREPKTLRDFLNEYSFDINYIEVETDSILLDLDTPGDYQKYQGEP